MTTVTSAAAPAITGAAITTCATTATGAATGITAAATTVTGAAAPAFAGAAGTAVARRAVRHPVLGLVVGLDGERDQCLGQ
jgi:hypothetical protein